MAKPNTAELNSRIRINKYVLDQDDNGGNIKTLIEFYDIWVKLEPLSGSKYLDNLDITYTKAFKMTGRYEVSRPLLNTDEIIHDDLIYSIQSVTQVEDGRRNFNVVIIYTDGKRAVAAPAETTFFWDEVEW